MTKKEFKLLCSYHKYTAKPKDNNVNALFFDFQSGEDFNGFKYCVYARASNATKKQLEDALYNIVTKQVDDTDWWIQLVAAPTDKQRFKVPLSASGLRSIIRYY